MCAAFDFYDVLLDYLFIFISTFLFFVVLNSMHHQDDFALTALGFFNSYICYPFLTTYIKKKKKKRKEKEKERVNFKLRFGTTIALYEYSFSTFFLFPTILSYRNYN